MSTEQTRRDIDKAIHNLMKYAEQEPWCTRHTDIYATRFRQAAQATGLPPEALVQAVNAQGAKHMIVGYIFEDLATRRFENEPQTLIETYLGHRGWREADVGRSYLQALNDAELTLWKIDDLCRGEYVVVKSFAKGAKPMRVYEKTATQYMNLDKCLVARVISLQDKLGFTGNILMLPLETGKVIHKTSGSLNKKIASHVKKAAVDKSMDSEAARVEHHAQQLTQSEIGGLIFDYWIRQFVEQANPVRPMIVNRDGDETVFCKVRFSIKPGADVAVEQGLMSLKTLDYDAVNNSWAWLPCARADIPISGVTLLGTISLQANALELFVNSKQRARLGEELLRKHLGELLGTSITVLETVDNVLNLRKATSQKIVAPHDDELQQFSKNYMDEHYRKTLDEPIPMLENMTPRECMKTSKGKRLVKTWLIYLEQSESQHAGSKQAYDFGWIWDELGMKRNK